MWLGYHQAAVYEVIDGGNDKLECGWSQKPGEVLVLFLALRLEVRRSVRNAGCTRGKYLCSQSISPSRLDVNIFLLETKKKWVAVIGCQGPVCKRD